MASDIRDEELLFLPEGEGWEVSQKQRPALRRRTRILYPMVVLFVVVAVGPLAWLSWKLLSTGRENLSTSQQQFQLMMASSVAGRLDSHIDGLEGRLQAFSDSFATIVEAQGLNGFERELSNKSPLDSILDEHLIALRLVTASGRSYQALPRGLVIPPEIESVVRRSVAGVFGAHEPARSVSAPVALTPEGDVAVVITSPVVASGATRAVLIGLVDISRVWRSVLSDNNTRHTIYAVDRSGRVFAHTDPAVVAADPDLSSTEIVQRYLMAEGRSKETMLFDMQRADGRKKSMLGSFDVTDQGWGIFVQVEEEAAYTLIHGLVRETVQWSIAMFLVACLLGILFAGNLSQPISRLTNAARAFSRGDFHARAPVSSRDEIGELAESFNRMAEDIEAYIQRLREYARENNELFLGTIKTLAEAIDAKDPYTRGHSARVTRIAVAIGRSMKLDQSALRDLYVSSLLHDVGKIGIDDSILKKPANLTREEFEVMKEHPNKGARIMEGVERMRSVVPGMKHHHEKWAGGGYPDGLKGEQIPLMARIIAAADVFDAITSDRPYSRAQTFEAATARLREIAGDMLDPAVVDAFEQAYRSGELAAEERRLAEKRVPVTMLEADEQAAAEAAAKAEPVDPRS